MNDIDLRTKLTTGRLELIPFGHEHLTDRYVSWLNDPDIVRFSELRHRTHTLDECRDYLRSMMGGHGFWAIHAAGVHIGNIATTINRPNSVADVSILIGDRDVWQNGYGTEAWNTVCEHLLSSGVRKVTAGTMSTNLPMLAVMRKSGMKPDGVRTKEMVLDGVEVDIVHMAVFADE